MKHSKNIGQPINISTFRRIKALQKAAKDWALDVTANIEAASEALDFNSYDFEQEFIRQMQHIWKRP